jgi:hypothetical protein
VIDRTPWTEEELRRLRRLLKQGMQPHQIAKKITTRSRNSIIAKIHRISGHRFKSEVDRLALARKESMRRRTELGRQEMQAIIIMNRMIENGAATRDWAIRHARRNGVRLHVIATSTGLTRERVRQICLGE